MDDRGKKKGGKLRNHDTLDKYCFSANANQMEKLRK
jgi:hypothetical protein